MAFPERVDFNPMMVRLRYLPGFCCFCIPFINISCDLIASQMKRGHFYLSPNRNLRRPLITFPLVLRSVKSADCDIDKTVQNGLELGVRGSV